MLCTRAPKNEIIKRVVINIGAVVQFNVRILHTLRNGIEIDHNNNDSK